MSEYNFFCVRLCLCGKQLISRTVLKHLRETEREGREGKRELCGRASVAGSVCETRCVSAVHISFGWAGLEVESEIIDFRTQHIKVLINDDLQTALKLYANAFPSQGCETMPRSPAKKRGKKKEKKKKKKLPVGVWQMHSFGRPGPSPTRPFQQSFYQH